MGLRDKMLEDMNLAGFKPATQNEYVRCVTHLVEYIRKPPLQFTYDDLRRFLLELVVEREYSQSTHKIYVAAFKFFFRVTLRRPGVVEHLRYPRVESQLPDVLSQAEVVRLLEAIDSLQLLAIVATLYATGLRLGEVRLLMPEDIDSDRMVIHVRQSKSGHGRHVTLSPRLLACLREYYRYVRPSPPWLFAGPRPGQPVSRETIQQGVRRAALVARLNKRVTPHVLRHTFATHALEMGTDLHTLQHLLGHSNIRTTTRYLHLSRQRISELKCPLDFLAPPADRDA